MDENLRAIELQRAASSGTAASAPEARGESGVGRHGSSGDGREDGVARVEGDGDASGNAESVGGMEETTEDVEDNSSSIVSVVVLALVHESVQFIG